MSRVFVSPLATPFHSLVSIFPIPSRYISIFRAPPPRYFSPSLIPEVSLDQALDVAERLRAGVEALRVSNPDGEPLRMTVSIGVALRRDAGDDLESLLVRADSALYQAKSGGRNRTEYAPA